MAGIPSANKGTQRGGKSNRGGKGAKGGSRGGAKVGAGGNNNGNVKGKGKGKPKGKDQEKVKKPNANLLPLGTRRTFGNQASSSTSVNVGGLRMEGDLDDDDDAPYEPNSAVPIKLQKNITNQRMPTNAFSNNKQTIGKNQNGKGQGLGSGPGLGPGEGPGSKKKQKQKQKPKQKGQEKGNNFKNGNMGQQKRPNSSFDSDDRKRARLERFNELAVPISSFYETKDPNAPIVGTCTSLEKNYMRLTSAANPIHVRPERILHQSLREVLKNYSQNQDYSYIINQLKSIRQDLTVQHIKNDFTLHVYEVNAQISIENLDKGEYNQCASQLKFLYSNKRINDISLRNKFYLKELEQILLRLIYMITTKSYSGISKIQLSLLTQYKNFELNDQEKILYEFIMTLIKVHSRILEGEYESFFVQLEKFVNYKVAHTAFQFLKNELLPEIRIRALLAMTYTFYTINISLVMEKLRFDEGTVKESNVACYTYLCKLGLKDEIDKTKLEMVLSKIRPIMRAQVAKFNKVDIKGQK